MPDPDLEITGAGGGGGGGGIVSLQKCFSAPWALVWSKNKGARAPRTPPLDPPPNKTQGWTMHPLSRRTVHSLT